MAGLADAGRGLWGRHPTGRGRALSYVLGEAAWPMDLAPSGSMGLDPEVWAAHES